MSSPSNLSLRFFAVTVLLGLFTAGASWSLIQWGSQLEIQNGDRRIPFVFLVTTVLLVSGSVVMQRGVRYVRIEQQRPFRRNLFLALLVGVLFVPLQCFGLWCLIQSIRPDDALTGASGFVFVFAGLHGMHFAVALLFLAYVTVKALANRYDHEYYLGVAACALFWHALGVAWAVIFGVLVITSTVS